jgi:hypothetical protein
MASLTLSAHKRKILVCATPRANMGEMMEIAQIVAKSSMAN